MKGDKPLSSWLEYVEVLAAANELVAARKKQAGVGTDLASATGPSWR